MVPIIVTTAGDRACAKDHKDIINTNCFGFFFVEIKANFVEFYIGALLFGGSLNQEMELHLQLVHLSH